MTRNSSGVPMDSEMGKEILAWVMAQEYAVLEFAEMDNGEMRIMDITDHHLELERDCGSVPEEAKADEVRQDGN